MTQNDRAALSVGLFIPSSVVVLVAGILLVVDGPWSFDQLWIVLGLIGYAATFATGIGILKPRRSWGSSRPATTSPC